MKRSRADHLDNNDYETKHRKLDHPEVKQESKKQFKTSVPHLTDLPTDILLQIFSRLSQRELMNSATVCKRWYMVSNHRSLWRQLTFTGYTPTTETVYLMLRKSPGLHYLKIVERDDATAIVKEICRSNKELRTLIIKRCRGEPETTFINARVICNLPKSCRELTSLTIKTTEINSIKFYNILGQMLPKLKKVNFSIPSGALGIFSRTCNKLEEVSTCDTFLWFGKIRGARYTDIEKFCTKMAETLTVLKLSAYFLGDDAMDPITACRHLRTLHIYEARNITNVGIMKVCELQNLRSFLISQACQVTTRTWIDLMSKPSLSRLENLELCVCDTLNDEALSIMKTNMQHLQKLQLAGCSNIRERDVKRIARGFRRLKRIIFIPVP
jgi:hypothetical protein